MVEAIKSSLGISDGFDIRWAVWTARPETVVPTEDPGTPYKAGFFIGDPVGDVVDEGAVRDAIVEALVAIGYVAADVPIEKWDFTSDCETTSILNAITTGVEANANAASVAEAVAFAVMQECTPRCIGWTWTTAGPTPTGCTPATPAWTVWGTWSFVGFPQCSITCWYHATTTCTYTRTRFRRTWHCVTCSWTETGSVTGTAAATSVVFIDDCARPATYTCPAGPDDTSCRCPPGTPLVWTGTPPC